MLLYLNRRFQLLKVQLETLPEDELINKYGNPVDCDVVLRKSFRSISTPLRRSSLQSDLRLMFVSSEFVSRLHSQIYELLRQYIAVRTITQHPEFNQVTTMIMMILDYLNNALEVNSESKSVEKQIVDGKWGDKM